MLRTRAKELAKGQHQKINSKPALTASAGQGWMLVAKVASVTLMYGVSPVCLGRGWLRQFVGSSGLSEPKRNAGVRFFFLSGRQAVQWWVGCQGPRCGSVVIPVSHLPDPTWPLPVKRSRPRSCNPPCDPAQGRPQIPHNSGRLMSSNPGRPVGADPDPCNPVQGGPRFGVADPSLAIPPCDPVQGRLCNPVRSVPCNPVHFMRTPDPIQSHAGCQIPCSPCGSSAQGPFFSSAHAPVFCFHLPQYWDGRNADTSPRGMQSRCACHGFVFLHTRFSLLSLSLSISLSSLPSSIPSSSFVLFPSLSLSVSPFGPLPWL